MCRKTSRITPVYAWDPDIPVCNWEDWVLPPGAEVAYTGRKRRGEAGRGNCPPVRFAQIVVEVSQLTAVPCLVGRQAAKHAMLPTP